MSITHVTIIKKNTYLITYICTYRLKPNGHRKLKITAYLSPDVYGYASIRQL